ncbi:MAG: hypothetical protein WDW36_007369 [Sanguina aurantia]
MIIPISLPGSDAVPEWALVELQGKLEGLTEAQVLGHVGTLMVAPNADKDAVQLTIGYHQMEGRWIPLKKPFAILQSSDGSGKAAGLCDTANQNTSGLQTNVEEGNTRQPHPSQAAAYAVVGVIRFKLLFKARPRALISKPQK